MSNSIDGWNVPANMLGEEAGRLYESARNASREEWMAEVVDDADPILSELVHRVANDSSQEEFVDFLTNGNLPQMELTDSELDAVAGGGNERRGDSSDDGRVACFNMSCTFYNNSN